jgi:glycerol-3-phosphate dehydrogenase
MFAGSDIPAIKALQEKIRVFPQKIHPDHPFTVAEVVWAVRNGMAETIEDVLAEEPACYFLDARAAIDSAHNVTELLLKKKDILKNGHNNRKMNSLNWQKDIY